MGMPAVVAPQRKYHDEPKTQNIQKSHSNDLRGAVLSAMTPTDKVNVAKAWGLRFVDEFPRAKKGWIECHAINRKDSTPSAGFDAFTGVYHEFGGETRSLSIFDLGVTLGAHRTWQEAIDCLRQRFIGSTQK